MVLRYQGSYYITDPLTNGDDGHFKFVGVEGAPPGATKDNIYAIYHNHPPLSDSLDLSWFSSDDVKMARDLGVSSFIFTPSGTRYYFAMRFPDGALASFATETLSVHGYKPEKNASSGFSY